MKKSTIRRKLTRFAMATSGAALLLACGAFVTKELRHLHTVAEGNLATIANIVCGNSTAAVVFEDARATREILAALHADGHIRQACIFDRFDNLVAEYTRPGIELPMLPAPPPAKRTNEAFHYQGDSIALYKNIVFNDEHIGTAYFSYDLTEHHGRLLDSAAIWALIITVACVVAYFLATRLQRSVSEPILRLAAAQDRVSREQNYSIRVEKSADDEIGLLVDGFNRILGEIEHRDQDLAAHRTALEEQVANRTQQLTCLNAQLLREKERAEAATRSKSAFLATMSHEIRTPMNAILGMTDLVLEGDLSLEQRTNIEVVKSSAQALLTTINDILDFSKIEAGKLALNPVSFNLRELLVGTMRLFAIKAEEKRLELICDVAPGVPPTVTQDPDRLRQILLNLVGNAMKFTETGAIAIRAQVESSANDKLLLRFQVRDTGIGISADKLESIFQPFEQADGTTTRKYGGTGLGLTICSRLATLMGGSIEVHSVPGEGSSFELTAQFDPGRQEHQTAEELPVALKGLLVVVAQGNKENRNLLGAMLRTIGLQPVLTDDVKAALGVLAQARQAGKIVAMAFVDRAFLEGGADAFWPACTEAAGGPLPIVTLQCVAPSPAQLGEIKPQGVLTFLLKPLHEPEVRKVVLEVLRRSRRMTKSPAARAPSTPEKQAGWQPLRVLLAEDNVVNQKIAISLLQKRGHVVTLAQNGREAVDALESQSFDAVLMDLMMPVLDGLSATRAIRQRELTTGQHIPIVAMTANAMTGDREKCLEAGMDDYLSKPIQKDLLFQTLENLALARLKSLQLEA